jgi:putative methionine-R-sulfoxide reductase with GAF domain
VPLAGTATEQAIRERRLVTYADVLADPDVPEGLRRIASQFGESYSVAVAPMLWEGRSIGSILVGRPELRAFDEKEQRLLRTFADQAVIAIQNARLFNETKEALEQQTATAEVLQVISSSVADTQPVFDKILDSCERLFAATGLGIYLVDEAGMLQRGGFRASNADSIPIVRSVAGDVPAARSRARATEIAIRERRVVHFRDVLADADAPAALRRIAGGAAASRSPSRRCSGKAAASARSRSRAIRRSRSATRSWPCSRPSPTRR